MILLVTKNGYYQSHYYHALSLMGSNSMATLTIPAFIPPPGLGANKDGRRMNLAYVCQRLTGTLTSYYLNAKTQTWGPIPVLNATIERGRDATGHALPGDAGALRGTYVPADPLNGFSDSDILGQFIVTYHDKSKDNYTIASVLITNVLSPYVQMS